MQTPYGLHAQSNRWYIITCLLTFQKNQNQNYMPYWCSMASRFAIPSHQNVALIWSASHAILALRYSFWACLLELLIGLALISRHRADRENKTRFNLLHAGWFRMHFRRLRVLFKINFLESSFQEYYQRVMRLWSRSGPMKPDLGQTVRENCPQMIKVVISR